MIDKYINKIIQGDALSVLKTLPDESVDMCMTSPPYWNLRDYGIEEQLGLEPSFQEYVGKLCDIFDEVKRVLKKEGTCWVNLGDTYGGSGNASGQKKDTMNLGYKTFEMGASQGNQKTTKGYEKCLLQIPARFSIEMTDNRGWTLRNEIIWHKRNGMPSSADDRFTVDYEKVFFYAKNKRYYFEQQFEKAEMNRWGGNKFKLKQDYGYKTQAAVRTRDRKDMMPENRNKRCVWTINTKPHSEAHFAVYPEKLCETPILTSCPESVCKKCGKARKKIYKGTSKEAFSIRIRDTKEGRIKHTDRKASQKEIENYQESVTYAGEGKKFVGYAKCDCNNGFKSGIVLDPFIGSGTTALTALKLGRKFIGIELSPTYIKIAEKRIWQEKNQLKLF